MDLGGHLTHSLHLTDEEIESKEASSCPVLPDLDPSCPFSHFKQPVTVQLDQRYIFKSPSGFTVGEADTLLNSKDNQHPSELLGE